MKNTRNPYSEIKYYFYLSFLLSFIEVCNSNKFIYPFEGKKGQTYICITQVCNPGFEPIECNKSNPGMGCKPCERGYFSDEPTFRRHKKKTSKSWIQKKCQKRYCGLINLKKIFF